MVTYIDFEELGKFYVITMDELKAKSYFELEKMEAEMSNSRSLKKLSDANFSYVARKFLICFEFLNQWFSEDEIIAATCRNADMNDLTEEYNFPVGMKCPYQKSEFLGTKQVTVREYDKNGREYLYGTKAMRDVYLIPNNAQGSLCHGKIILDLLYGRYPKLREFRFKAFGVGSREEFYEIYPENNIYTPFRALMGKDIEAIKKRNIEYAHFYHYGDFTIEKVEERLASKEAEDYFDVIRTL